MWFGVLKVAGVSPVAALVAGTLPWVDPQFLLPALGAAEVLLGTALVAGVGLRLALPVIAAHLCGTFLTFLMLPGLMFTHGNPLVLTATGEFVMKNVVLIGATLVLIAHAPAKVRRQAPEHVLAGPAAAAHPNQGASPSRHRQVTPAWGTGGGVTRVPFHRIEERADGVLRRKA